MSARGTVLSLLLAVTLTAYCPCERCCGVWAAAGLTSGGTRPKAGFTLASRGFPIGTILEIGGQVYMVQDRGGPKDGGLDVFHVSHEEARRFGVRRAAVKVLHVPEGRRITYPLGEP